jgi:hypothetical protein
MKKRDLNELKTLDQLAKSTPDAPKIEFPCDYPIKILGEACEEFIDTVVAVVRRHDPSLDTATLTSRDSSKGSFRSVTVTITATGEQQLEMLFTELKSTRIVKMVL